MPWHINPNALVSLLMTVCRLFMLLATMERIAQLKWGFFEQHMHKVAELSYFDQASRGPWGAFLLLYRIHWTAAVASLGAILTILAITADPFAQQVLSFPLQQVSRPSNDTIMWRAQALDRRAFDRYYSDAFYTYANVQAMKHWDFKDKRGM